MLPLKTQWKNLFHSIGSPWIILFIGLSFGFIYVSLKVTDKYIVAITAGLFSVCTSVVGGLIGNIMKQLAEGDSLRARGTLAVRSLKILFNRITKSDVRLRTHLGNIEQKDITNARLFTNCIDETRQSLALLQDDVLNAMEAWTDIIPEADIRTKIGEFNAAELELASYKTQLVEITTQRDKAENRSAQTRQSAEEEILKLNNKIKLLETEVKKKEVELRNQAITGIPAYSGIANIATYQFDPSVYKGRVLMQACKCKVCGRGFLGAGDLCEDCEKKKP